MYWEPVAGTGERVMVGVLHGYGNDFRAVRTIRDDVLDCLFGKASIGLRQLIDQSLMMYQSAAHASQSIEPLGVAIGGLYAGPLRATAAVSAFDLLHTACLLYSSLGNLDKLDEAEDSDSPQQEEVNRRFGSEVREEISKLRPDLVAGFGRSTSLITGGQKVKFGFFSTKAILHFTVLHPVRQSASMRDARARLFELQRARDMSGISSVALIAAIPRDDDATLGARQREQLRLNRIEIEHEADSVKLRWYAVHNAIEGANQVIEIAG
jgi:hypothetical protein